MIAVMESINWVAEEAHTEVNEVLDELGLPQLALTVGFYDVTSMIRRIVAGYRREIRIQSIHGGIRQPAVVLHNKIRHELTNYDDVRDALTQSHRSGVMDMSLVLDIRVELVNLFCKLCEHIIDSLPTEVEFSHKDEWIVIPTDDVYDANRNYRKRELINIQNQRIECGAA